MHPDGRCGTRAISPLDAGMRRLTRRRFVALGSGLPLLGCDAVLGPSDPAPCPFMRGETLAAFQSGDFRAARAARLISSAQARGFDWVAVAPGWYQSHAAATSMRPHSVRTPDDQGVTNLILQARALGLRVLLKPFVDSLDGVWRAEFEPPDVMEWLRSYRQMHLHYATLAAAAGADLLSMGVELNFADGVYPDEWRRLVAETRAIYAGPLTYAANHSPGANGGGYTGVRFWEALDFIGIDAYFPLATDAQLGPLRLGLA